jgi:hypothetical protein
LCSSIHAHRFIASPSSNSVIFKQQIPLPSRIHSSIGQSIAPCFHNPPMFASPHKNKKYNLYKICICSNLPIGSVPLLLLN